MEKRRKRMIKQCLSFALSLVMALTIVTPVKAAQQQYVPTQEDIEITKNIKDIQTAGYYSAALMKNGDLWTWGSMAAMDKYHAIDSSLYTPKTPSVFMTNVKEFVLTDTYYAAIKNDGTLWMWGCDTNGELGIGDCELNNFFPRQVNIPKRVKKVILSNKGWNKTAAITEDGDLYMWGDNSAYGLGIGENSDNSKSYNTPQNFRCFRCKYMRIDNNSNNIFWKSLCVGKYLRIYGSDDTLYTRRSQEYRTYFRADHKNSI